MPPFQPRADHDVRSVVLDDRAVGLVVRAFFNRRTDREAVAAVEGVGDLVGGERTVGDQTVVDDTRRVAGEGRRSSESVTPMRKPPSST